MKKNKNKIKLLTASLMAFLSLGAMTTTTYAYWNMLVKTENAVVNVGEGLETVVNATVLAPEGKTLVPVGQAIPSDNQVEEVELIYEVKLSRAVSAALDLTVEASEVKIGGDPTYANLVNIVIDAPDTLVDEVPQEVVVTVTIAEPTEAEYNAIVNKAITFKLTFTVSQL